MCMILKRKGKIINRKARILPALFFQPGEPKKGHAVSQSQSGIQNSCRKLLKVVTWKSHTHCNIISCLIVMLLVDAHCCEVVLWQCWAGFMGSKISSPVNPSTTFLTPFPMQLDLPISG